MGSQLSGAGNQCLPYKAARSRNCHLSHVGYHRSEKCAVIMRPRLHLADNHQVVDLIAANRVPTIRSLAWPSP